MIDIKIWLQSELFFVFFLVSFLYATYSIMSQRFQVEKCTVDSDRFQIEWNRWDEFWNNKKKNVRSVAKFDWTFSFSHHQLGKNNETGATFYKILKHKTLGSSMVNSTSDIILLLFKKKFLVKINSILFIINQTCIWEHGDPRCKILSSTRIDRQNTILMIGFFIFIIIISSTVRHLLLRLICFIRNTQTTRTTPSKMNFSRVLGLNFNYFILSRGLQVDAASF